MIDTFNAPLLELARAIQVRPQSRIFHASGYLMFGGYQNWDFWYDRQTHRLRYKYASGGETSGGHEEGVWSNVTDTALKHLAQDQRTGYYRGTRLLGFETLGKYGGKLERVWKRKATSDSMTSSHLLHGEPAAAQQSISAKDIHEMHTLFLDRQPQHFHN
jgi:hypothetical protein